jgi:hypothetical protein
MPYRRMGDMVYGIWHKVCGIRYMVYGKWYIINGIWYMVNDIRAGLQGLVEAVYLDRLFFCPYHGGMVV